MEGRVFLPMLSKNRPTFTLKHSAVFQALLSEPWRCLFMSSSFTMIPSNAIKFSPTPHWWCQMPHSNINDKFSPNPSPRKKNNCQISGRYGDVSIMYHTRDCFIGISKHREESSKYYAAEYFDEIRGVSIADETLSSVWCIFSIEAKTKEKTAK